MDQDARDDAQAGSDPTCESGLSVRADPKLLCDGWVRRHLADPDRAEEWIELYTALGYEVRAQKLSPTDFGPACQQCAALLCQSYVLIYTRKTEPIDKPALPEHKPGSSDDPAQQQS